MEKAPTINFAVLFSSSPMLSGVSYLGDLWPQPADDTAANTVSHSVCFGLTV